MFHVEWIVDGRKRTWLSASPCGPGLPKTLSLNIRVMQNNNYTKKQAQLKSVTYVRDKCNHSKVLLFLSIKCLNCFILSCKNEEM